jgi:hypothetical protein
MNRKKTIQRLLAASVCGLWIAPAVPASGDHVVSRAELRRELQRASATRRDDLQAVERLLRSERAGQALKSVRLDPARAIQAAALLEDEELARLAARAREAERDFQAGALSNEHLTYIVIALSAAVLVLIFK